jgi:hypothetical protein
MDIQNLEIEFGFIGNTTVIFSGFIYCSVIP